MRNLEMKLFLKLAILILVLEILFNFDQSIAESIVLRDN
jgi:hypothetical protein